MGWLKRLLGKETDISQPEEIFPLKDLVLKRLVEELEERRTGVSSYFDLIPLRYKSTVQKIARDNFSYFSYFKEQFANNFQDFLEAISKNWLLKYSSFDQLAKSNGFVPLEESHRSFIDKYVLFCLTRNASYLLLGPGSRGKGASMRYSRIPLRRHEEIHDQENYPAGVKLKNEPKKDNPLHTNVMKTTVLISLYVKEIDRKDATGTIGKIDDGMRTCFATVDNMTIHEVGGKTNKM